MADETTLQKIAGYVKTWAPGISAALVATGVGAPIAGGVAALGALANMFALPATATHDDILAAVTNAADPDTKLKIIAAENAFQLATRDQDIKTLQVQLADVQGARDMHSSHEKTTGKTDINLYTLSWVIVVGFFGVVALLLFVPIPTNQTNVIFTLLGTLGAGFMLVLQFFYGTNRSSETKTDMIFNSSKNPTPSSGQIIGENN